MTALKFEDHEIPNLDDCATLDEQFIPGRRAIFAIVEASLLELVPEGPVSVLVVGAGRGEEILRHGSDNPDWSFVGVDSYEPMVDLARRHLVETPAGDRAQVEATAIDDLDEKNFDAATCIHTAYFVPDDSSKLAFFTAIRARMKPGTPLAVVDGVGVEGEPQTELLRRIWTRRAVLNGVMATSAENFKKVALSVERQEELLTSAGFERITPIFRGPAIKGCLVFA